MRTKRIAVIVTLTATVLATLVILPIAADNLAQPMCVVAQNWVNDHRLDLPDTLPGLLSLPPAHRMRTFSALSPAKRSELFVEYYQLFLERTPGLTNEQIGLIQEVMVQATPDLYEHKTGEHPGGQHANEEMATRLVEAFSPERLSEMVISRSPTEVNYFSFVSLHANAQARLASLVNSLPVAQAQECDCSTNAWCELFVCPDCQCYGGTCVTTETGCGVWFCEPCAGECWEL